MRAGNEYIGPRADALGEGTVGHMDQPDVRTSRGSLTPNRGDLIRSPAVSAAVLVVGTLVCVGFGWSCARWEHLDPFASLPVQLGGRLLVVGAPLVCITGLVGVWRRRDASVEAYVAALYAYTWLAVPTALLLFVRIVV